MRALFSQIETHIQRPFPAVCIAGATASGKSALALEIATRYNGIIINADSRQIYQGLPLLTAQPSLEEIRSAPHQLYQYLENRHPGITVATWMQDAKACIADAHENGRLPILVGGTGFYLKSLEEGLHFIPPVPRMTEMCVQKYYPEEEPYSVLQRVDPICAANITPNDQQRILRALSVYHATGKPLSHWWSLAKTSVVPHVQWFKLYCDGDKITLKQRIEARFQNLCTQGLLEEVAAFSEPHDSPLSHAIGLKILQDHLAEMLSWTETEQKFCSATWQYAKAQRTWFKRYFQPEWTVSYS